MRIVASIAFSLAALIGSLPASAHGAGVAAAASVHQMGCYPWSGCRK